MTGTLLNISWDCSVELLRPGRLDCDDVKHTASTGFSSSGRKAAGA